jgi:hypothetical protein
MVLKQKPRNMTAQSLGTFFWPAQRRYMDNEGIYLGIDQATQLPIRVDPFGEYKEKTPTFLALGRPGAGKSVWLRTMMLSALVAGNNVMAVDIEGEMQEFCDQTARTHSSTAQNTWLLSVKPCAGGIFPRVQSGMLSPKPTGWHWKTAS